MVMEITVIHKFFYENAQLIAEPQYLKGLIVFSLRSSLHYSQLSKVYLCLNSKE